MNTTAAQVMIVSVFRVLDAASRGGRSLTDPSDDGIALGYNAPK